jgi:hypothetical protein
MNKRFKLVLSGLFVIAIVGFIVLKFVNKPVTDFASEKATATFNFNDIMNKVSNDTASLIELKDKLVAVSGQITQISNDESGTTIVLGDTNSMSTIICQIDKRYINDFSTSKPGENIAVKGIITGYSIDTELGLGNTVEMNYCSLQK